MTLPLQGRPTVLGLLRDDARNWWAHTTHKQVNASTRDHLRMWRSCRDEKGCLVIGHGGTTLYYTRNARLESHSTGPMLEIALRLQCQVIDLTPIRRDELLTLMQGPMYGFDEDRFCPGDGPYGALDTIEWASYGALARHLGGKTYNLPIDSSLVKVAAPMLQALLDGVRWGVVDGKACRMADGPYATEAAALVSTLHRGKVHPLPPEVASRLGARKS